MWHVIMITYFQPDVDQVIQQFKGIHGSAQSEWEEGYE